MWRFYFVGFYGNMTQGLTHSLDVDGHCQKLVCPKQDLELQGFHQTPALSNENRRCLASVPKGSNTALAPPAVQTSWPLTCDFKYEMAQNDCFKCLSNQIKTTCEMRPSHAF